MKLIVGLILIVLVVAEEISAQNRIISGTPATVGQFPWQVIIKEYKEDKIKCGGSIISNTWVLTAAHCTIDMESLYLVFGTIYLYDNSTVSMTTTEFIRHPDYNNETLANDVSLIKLPESLEFSDTIKSIQLLQNPTDNFVGTVATIAGFGFTSDEDLTIPKYLLWAQVEVVDNEVCVNEFGTYIQDSNICAKGYNDSIQSICVGDSGGPLIAQDQQGNWMQIGINSFVAEDRCADGYPSVYVRLSSFLTYITETTGVTM